MVDPCPNDSDQLSTNIDHLEVQPLIVMSVPLLCALFHLSRIVGRQGQMLESTTSGHRTSRNEVIKRERIKGLERTPWTFNGLINRPCRRINPIGIVTSGPSVLDIVPHLELFEALRMSIVDILGVRDELRRRRRSVGGRHVKWRTGGWCKTQWLTLLLAAHVRHGLIWSSLPLPRDSSIP